jgi:hypothetical protein
MPGVVAVPLDDDYVDEDEPGQPQEQLPAALQAGPVEAPAVAAVPELASVFADFMAADAPGNAVGRRPGRGRCR